MKVWKIKMERKKRWNQGINRIEQENKEKKSGLCWTINQSLWSYMLGPMWNEHIGSEILAVPESEQVIEIH